LVPLSASNSGRVIAGRCARLQAIALAFAFAGALPLPVDAQSAPPAAPSTTETQDAARLVREGRLDDAMKLIEQALTKNPRNAQARFLRAVILADTGKSAEASAAFEAMTQEFPELPEPYNNLAVIHAAAGRYDTARAHLLRAIAVAPNYLTAHENLGDLHIAMAAEAYAQAARLDPGSSSLKAKLQLARDASTRLRAAR
jgi:tetratricopeptide (TPR) repeat protein